MSSQNSLLRCLEVCDLLTFKRKSTDHLTECVNLTCPQLLKHSRWLGTDLGKIFYNSNEDEDEAMDNSEEFNEYESKEITRTKKWQYADPMQMCMMSKCQGLSGVDFYQCVYGKCITGNKEEEER